MLKELIFFNLISVFEYFNDINNLSIGHLITKIYKDFVYLYDMSFDILDNKVVYTYLGSGNIDGYIKIGKTNNIDKRENTIRTGNIDFKIIAFVGRDIENELHSKFEIKRMEREWFHLSDNDIDNIINEYGFIRVRNSVKDTPLAEYNQRRLPSFSHFFANLFNDSISLHSSGVHSIPASVKYFTPILLICLIYEPLIRLVLVYPFFL